MEKWIHKLVAVEVGVPLPAPRGLENRLDVLIWLDGRTATGQIPLPPSPGPEPRKSSISNAAAVRGTGLSVMIRSVRSIGSVTDGNSPICIGFSSILSIRLVSFGVPVMTSMVQRWSRSSPCKGRLQEE